MEKQRWAGVDIANDGEQGRVGFQTYVPQRMSGFGGKSKRPFGREWVELPLFTEKFQARLPKTGKVFGCPEAVSELKYHDKEAIKTELARFKRQAAAIPSRPSRRCSSAEPSPGIIATTMLNAYYKTYEDYLDAIAREMHLRIQGRGRCRIDPADRRTGFGDGARAAVSRTNRKRNS